MSDTARAEWKRCTGKTASAFTVKSPLAISLIYQLLAIIPAFALLLLYDKISACSFVLGALVYILPNLYFTLYAFRYRGSNAVHGIAHSFSWGESGKLALAAVGFALIFRFVAAINVPVLFAGYISMIILQWFIGRRVANEFAATS